MFWEETCSSPVKKRSCLPLNSWLRKREASILTFLFAARASFSVKRTPVKRADLLRNRVRFSPLVFWWNEKVVSGREGVENSPLPPPMWSDTPVSPDTTFGNRWLRSYTSLNTNNFPVVTFSCPNCWHRTEISRLFLIQGNLSEKDSPPHL